MVIILLFGFFFLLFVVIIYYILSQSRYQRTAITILSIFIILILYLFNLNTIDEIFYFKSDAKNDLMLVNLYLKDDFQIIENNVEGFPERYQKTILKISEEDKKRIISEIKNAKYFQVCEDERSLYYKMSGKSSKRIVTNYIVNGIYIKETYEQNSGYVALSEFVALNENSNNIELNRIED